MMHLFSRVYLSEIVNHQESAKMTFHFSSSLSGYKAFDILIELQSFPCTFRLLSNSGVRITVAAATMVCRLSTRRNSIGICLCIECIHEP